MTEFKRSIFVIPSASLDDLPKKMGHAAAMDFLAAWTSQWDPRLLNALGGLPEWKRADTGSLDLEDALVVCPTISASLVDQPLRERLDLNRCELVESNERTRQALVAALVNVVDSAAMVRNPSPLLVEDFYALGYAVLQIQILARKLRYSWNIDWIMFTEQALSAAKASLTQDAEETERWLQTCFDSLSQERDRYCSQQAYLLDVVLMAATTLGTSLTRQVETKHPSSIIATADVLALLAQRNPAASAIIQERLVGNSIALVGGLATERLHPYMSAPAIVRDLQRGLRAYAALGVGIPKVFTRYSPGFTATLPTWLTQFGYTGILLSGWSGGVLPTNDQAKIRWQANSDGKSIDTVINSVLDAASADTYVDLAEFLARQLDYHHVPTVVLAHWPGLQLEPWLDLQRVVDRSPALGKFHTVDSYFTNTTSPYSSESYPGNSFRIALPDSIPLENDLHLGIRYYEQLQVAMERLGSLRILWTHVRDKDDSSDRGSSIVSSDLDRLRDELDAWFDVVRTRSELHAVYAELAGRIQLARSELLGHIDNVLAAQTNDRPESQRMMHLLVNPSNHPVRYFFDKIPGNVDKNSSTRIVATEPHQGGTRMIVDVPPFGFTRFTSSSSGKTDSTETETPAKSSIWNRLSGKRPGIADTDWTLSNEYMEVQIDPKRGHLRSVYIANKRGSRLSGMVSMVRGNASSSSKWKEEDVLEITNVQLRMTRNSSLVGTIEATGVCTQPDGTVARVTAAYTLWRGARWIDFEVRVENVSVEGVSCFWRTAWLNEGASVAAWHHGIKGKLQSALQSATELIEIDDAEHKIYFATRGLSAHRRPEPRILASQIPLDDQGGAKASFAIGIDWPRPYATALDMLDQPWLLSGSQATLAGSDSGAWLAQCSLPNVYFYFSDPAPTLEPDLIPKGESETWTGHASDCCVWIQETQGKSGSAKLSFFKDVEEAWRVDCHGREFAVLPVSDGQIIFSVSANEQSRILIRWKRDPKASSASES